MCFTINSESWNPMLFLILMLFGQRMVPLNVVEELSIHRIIVLLINRSEPN